MYRSSVGISICALHFKSNTVQHSENMPRRNGNKKRNTKVSKTSSDEQHKKQKTEHYQEDSRSHCTHTCSEPASESGDAVRMPSFTGSMTYLSSDLSIKQQDYSDVGNALSLNEDLFHHESAKKCKVQHEKKETQGNVTRTPDRRTLLNVIASGTLYQVIELLKGGHTFSQDELDNALIAACQHGHKYIIQALIRLGANVQYKDTNGNTPLMISVRNGFIDIVRFLLMKKADINTCDSTGNTALILAIRPSGSTEMVKILLAQEGININHQNQDGYTVFMKALEVMDIDTVKILLESFNAVEESVNYKWETTEKIADKYGIGNIWLLFSTLIQTDLPLATAYGMRDIESFNIMLDCQFSDMYHMQIYIEDELIKIVDNFIENNVTTISDNEMSMIQSLLKYEPDRDIVWNSLSNLMCVAIERGQYKLVQLLCKYFDQQKQSDHISDIQEQALIKAAEVGKCDMLQLLLKYSANIESYTFCDPSLLNSAVGNGHIECAKLLIQNGAEIDIGSALQIVVDEQMVKSMNFLMETYRQEIVNYISELDSQENDLLFSAARKENLEIIGHILDAGADVNGSSFSGQTPLDGSKDGNVASFLIRRGANVNQVTSTNSTPLLNIIKYFGNYHSSNTEVLEVLLENGASVNARNDEHKTLLMLAASNGKCKSILPLLLDCGANLNDQDNEGNTALIHAVCRGCSKNVSILLQSAKNKNDFINVQNHAGVTSLMYAVMQRELEIIKELIVNYGADVNIKDVNGNTALLHALTYYNEQTKELITTLIKAGSNVNCQNNDGLSPLMIASRECLLYPISVLLDSGADVNAVSMKDNTKTAISFFLCETYLNRGEIICLEAFLERGASLSYLNPHLFHQIIVVGKIAVVPKLIRHGLAPSDVKPSRLLIMDIDIIPTVSPLCVALLVGNVSLCRYFFENLFLTNSDVSSLTCNKNIRHILEMKKNQESLDFLNEISSQPFSLFQLTFVSISSTVGSSPGRELRVNMLPLPQVIKDKLLFQSEVVPLNIQSESSAARHPFLQLDRTVEDIVVDDSDGDSSYVVGNDYYGDSSNASW